MSRRTNFCYLCNSPLLLIDPNTDQCKICYDKVFCSSRCKDKHVIDYHLDERRGKVTTSSNSQKRKFLFISIRDFEFLNYENNLGKGSYSEVKLVRSKMNGKIFALKMISKRLIKEKNLSKNVETEISNHKKLRHPYIIKLYDFFEDNDFVYLVLGYAENNNLYEYVKKKGKLTEKEAFIFFIQTCIAVDYMHKREIFHRDIKPENLLIDQEGNIKLCDFGWSTTFQNNINQINNYTLCGTLDYIAPEMILGNPYTSTVDIWALGVLLFELLHGKPPFQGHKSEEKIQNITNNIRRNFNSDISLEARDLINNLMSYKAANRMRICDIFDHSFTHTYEKIFGLNIKDFVYKEKNSSRISTENDSYSFIETKNLLSSEGYAYKKKSHSVENTDNNFSSSGNSRNQKIFNLNPFNDDYSTPTTTTSYRLKNDNYKRGNHFDFSQNSNCFNRWSHFATDNQTNRNMENKADIAIFTSENSSHRNYEFRANHNINLSSEPYSTRNQDSKNNKTDFLSSKNYGNIDNVPNSNHNERNSNPFDNYQNKNTAYEKTNRNFDNKYNILNERKNFFDDPNFNSNSRLAKREREKKNDGFKPSIFLEEETDNESKIPKESINHDKNINTEKLDNVYNTYMIMKGKNKFEESGKLNNLNEIRQKTIIKNNQSENGFFDSIFSILGCGSRKK